MYVLLFLVTVLLGSCAPFARGGGFDDLKSVGAKAGAAKDAADDNQMSEEQFYRCFSDINCNLGKEAFDAMFTCYKKVNESERVEYARWFKDSPKGDFQESDLTLYGVNAKFCTLTTDEQRIINDHFATKAAAFLQDKCKEKSRRNQCLRLKKGTECISALIESYVVTGKCETIVKAAPIPDEMMTAITLS